jgi:hypothetical protein
MATYFLSLNRGQGQNTSKVAIATAAPSTDCYLQINTAANQTKMDVIVAIETFKKYILGNGIPGGQPGVDLPPL